jgi:hypothetical protein
MAFQCYLFFNTPANNKTISFFLSFFYLAAILGLIIICYDDNLTDNIDPPVFASESPNFFDHAYTEIEFLKFIKDSIELSFIEKSSLLTRSPPFS